MDVPEGARPPGGLPPSHGKQQDDMIFTQIPDLPNRPVGFLLEDLTRARAAGRGFVTASENETGRRDDKAPPPRYDRSGLRPGGAANEGSDGSESSAKQNHSKFHGAILSLDSQLGQPPGPRAG